MISSLILSVAMFGAANSTDCAPPSEWASTPVVIKSSKCSCECECCGVAPPSTKKPLANVPEKTPPAPLIEAFSEYRMTDKYGVAWKHSDKKYLESFIQQRNYVAPVQTYFYPAGGMSSCATGNCPR